MGQTAKRVLFTFGPPTGTLLAERLHLNHSPLRGCDTTSARSIALAFATQDYPSTRTGNVTITRLAPVSLLSIQDVPRVVGGSSLALPRDSQ